MMTWLAEDRDLDVKVAAFLRDDADVASARSVDAALAHARTHPRRPDPLRALRRDPMDPRPRAFGARPRISRTWLLAAAVASVVVAGLAGAAGGWFDARPSVVVPGPTPTPTPSAAIGTAAPVPSPAVFRLDLPEVIGADAVIEIIDESGTLADALPVQTADGGSVAAGTVDVWSDPEDPSRLILTWTGLPCTTTHRLDIAADGRTMQLTWTACDGDAIPRDLAVELRFDGAVAADAVSVVLDEAD